MFTAFVIAHPVDETLAGLRSFGQELLTTGVSKQAMVGNGVEVLGVATVAEFHEWLAEQTMVDGGTVFEGVNLLSVELDTHHVEPISCGDHSGPFPENVLVTVHPDCVNHL